MVEDSLHHPVSIAIACDSAYARPAGVLLRSIARHISGPWHVWILDAGLTEKDRQRLRLCVGDGVPLRFLDPDAAVLDGVQVTGHVSVATYYRLLLPQVLPRDVTRVLYLDVDILCLRDIRELWNYDLGESAIGAVEQTGLVARACIPNYSELGLVPDRTCFNAGVLLLDLDKWREKDLATTVLEYLRIHAGHLNFWDQDGLNASFFNSFQRLPAIWNYVVDVSDLQDVEEEMPARIREAAGLVHFASALKPWDFFCEHPVAEIWYAHLSETPWGGWEPAPPLRVCGNRHYWGTVARRLLKGSRPLFRGNAISSRFR